MNNKIAVVTGAGGTLCSEIAIELAKEGATVFLVGRTKEKLEATADKIGAAGGAPAILCPCDVTDRAAIAALAETVKKAGGCDYLINGAGGNDIKAMPTITEFDPREVTGTLPEGQKGIYDIDTLISFTEAELKYIQDVGESEIKFGNGDLLRGWQGDLHLLHPKPLLCAICRPLPA